MVVLLQPCFHPMLIDTIRQSMCTAIVLFLFLQQLRQRQQQDVGKKPILWNLILDILSSILLSHPLLNESINPSICYLYFSVHPGEANKYPYMHPLSPPLVDPPIHSSSPPFFVAGQVIERERTKISTKK